MILLFDLNVMFPPTALLAMVPASTEMPVPDWFGLLPTTSRSPPPASTTTLLTRAARPVPFAVPVTVMFFAESVLAV